MIPPRLRKPLTVGVWCAAAVLWTVAGVNLVRFWTAAMSTPYVPPYREPIESSFGGNIGYYNGGATSVALSAPSTEEDHGFYVQSAPSVFTGNSVQVYGGQQRMFLYGLVTPDGAGPVSVTWNGNEMQEVKP